MSETPSADLSDFQEIIGKPGQTQHGGKCWHAKLSPERQAQVDEAHKVGYSLVEISKVMHDKWNVTVGSKTVGSHYRENGCSCKKLKDKKS